MSKSKPDEKKPHAIIHDDVHASNAASFSILTPETGMILSSPFEITGCSPVGLVVITAYDINSGAIFVAPTRVPVINGFYTYPCDLSNFGSNNTTITVTNAFDATMLSRLNGLVFLPYGPNVHGIPTLKSSIKLTLDAYFDGEVKKLKCTVLNKDPKAKDYFFAKFIKCNINTAPPTKAKVDLKSVQNVNPLGNDVLTDLIVNTNDVYIVQVVYCDDDNVFCSYAGKIFI